MADEANPNPTPDTLEIAQDHWLNTNETYKGLDTESKKTFSKYKTADDAVKGSLEAIKLVGRSVQIPGEKATEDEIAKFNAKIRQYQRIPEKAEDYKLTRQQLPEGHTYDEEMEKAAVAIAHKYGVQPAALQELSDLMHSRFMTQFSAATEAQKKAEIEAQEKRTKETAAALTELEKEPEFKTKIAMVQHLLKKEGAIELWEELEANKGNNVHLIKFLMKLAPTHVAEGEIIGGEGSSKNASDVLGYPEMK